MTSDHVFGSDQLSPELLRGATFAEQDGRVDAAEVRAFLDRVASSLEVFLAQDAPSALRAEFARNAEIAQQVLDAGQSAAEQLRRQAADDARRILDETREATERLRETMEGEIAQSRAQVETMRAQFIQDLRDLYDRIGASLYRFERAADEAQHAPIQEPTRSGEELVGAPGQDVPADVAPQAAPPSSPPASSPPASAAPETPEPAVAEPVAPTAPQPEAAPASTPPSGHAPELPEGAKPPAWQQLPPEAWAASPAASGAPAEPVDAADTSLDAFAVQEDEPLAPGEPLVDLREFAQPADVAAAPTPPAPGATATGPDQPAAAAPDTATAPDTAAAPDAGGDGLGSSWLDTPADVAGSEERDPALAHDDMLAEALIAGTTLPEDEAPAADAPAGPDAPVDPMAQPLGGSSHTVAEPAGAASPDAVAVRQLILDSLAAGQTRESIETYLRDQMGFVEPGALVDAAIGSAGAPGS